jgi:hypothetical protein
MSKKIIISGIVVVLVVVVIALLFAYRGQVDQDDLVDQPEDQEDSIPTELVGATEDEVFESEKFSILRPQGWAEYEIQEGVAFSFMVTADNLEEMMEQGDPVQLMVRELPREEETLDGYIDEIRAYLADEADHYGAEAILVVDEYDTEVSGWPAKYIEIKYELEDYQAMAAAILVATEQDIWSLEFSGPFENWNENKSVFEKIIESFQIK